MDAVDYQASEVSFLKGSWELFGGIGANGIPWVLETQISHGEIILYLKKRLYVDFIFFLRLPTPCHCLFMIFKE